MAKNYSIVSATFDGQAMGSPRSYRVAVLGRTECRSAGVDRYVSTLKLSARKVVVRVSFNDQTDLEAMQTGKHGVTGTLSLATKDLSGASRTCAVANATCVEVAGDAQHADYGRHVATFEAISSDGATNPVTWT
jgi:hypothetical protein